MAKPKKGNPNGWIGRKADQIMLTIRKKGMDIAAGIEEKSKEFITKNLPNTTAEQDCKTVLKLTKIQGIPYMRNQVLFGFASEWAKMSTEQIDAELAKYRNEPLFEKVLAKLNITWDELDKLAADTKEAV